MANNEDSNGQEVSLVGPLKEITIRMGCDAETGPFIHIEGNIMEPPTVIGGEPKVTPMPDLIAFSEIANVLGHVFVFQQQAKEAASQSGPKVLIARGKEALHRIQKEIRG